MVYMSNKGTSGKLILRIQNGKQERRTFIVLSPGQRFNFQAVEIQMNKKVENFELWAQFLTWALPYDISKSLYSLVRKGIQNFKGEKQNFRDIKQTENADPGFRPRSH